MPLNDAYPESFRRDVRNRWAKSGIKFYFNEERHDYNVSRENTIRLNNGENIDADLVVCTLTKMIMTSIDAGLRRYLLVVHRDRIRSI